MGNGFPKILPALGACFGKTRALGVSLIAADCGAFIDISNGSGTQVFDGSIYEGWFCFYRNSGIGDITIPSSDGRTNWKMYPGEMRFFQYSNSVFSSFVVSSFYKKFLVTEQFIKPPGYAFFDIEVFGAPGGGGSGYSGGAGTLKGGGQAGAGGGYMTRRINADDVADTETVTIGAGGVGGAAVTNATGNDGTAGGTTSFGSFISATGGAGGHGGSGLDSTTSAGGTASGCNDANQYYTGSNGAASNPSTASASVGTGRPMAGVSGGAGGGESAGNALWSPAAGGARNSTSGGGGAAGTSVAGAPTAGANGGDFQGGGGGGSAQSVDGASGGAGGLCGGGGGGGSSRTGLASGPGNSGGNGLCIISGG